MKNDNGHGGRPLKQRLLAEVRLYGIITLYLWLFLGCFTLYRRWILAETGVNYAHYGVALVEALVIAKVVLVGRIFGFSRRFEDRPLIVPVIYKSIIFALLVMVFGIVEHLAEGWIHRKGLLEGLHEFASVGGYEMAARMLTLSLAFVPFFAFWELGRVLGMDRLQALFFLPPQQAVAGAPDEPGRAHLQSGRGAGTPDERGLG